MPHAALAELTRRQVEILRMAAVGIAPRVMADELNISLATVRSHLRSLRDALDCHSTAALGAFWRQHAREWLEIQLQLAEPWASVKQPEVTDFRQPGRDKPSD
jgi:DNA-binding CsgD family transcriptional regulator